MGDPDSNSNAKLRVAGAWSGLIEVSLDDWTIADLRSHLARLSGFAPESINLICAGKILKDESLGKLKQLGLGNNSKLLMTRVLTQQANAFLAEEERLMRLNRIKKAADAMAKRCDENLLSEDDFDFQLENQSGVQLKFDSDSDRRALMMGLMLHAKARDLIQHNNYVEAVEVLNMAEEAFALCNSKILEAVDNVAFLQIDLVWCYFMLKDIEKLADAGKRLSTAREGLRQSHGPHLERLRILQGGFCPELAIYVRLELLEGVAAFHSGRLEAAKKCLVSAQSKYNQLQVSDEALALLAGMGFSLKESKRALRVSEQNVSSAIEFVMEERRKKNEKREEDRHHQQQRRQQKQYGMTPDGKPVDLAKLEEIVSIGYENILAAEALRQSENNIQAALDILTDPSRNTDLQSTLLHTKQRRRKRLDEGTLEELIAMGFQRDQAIQALQNSEDKSHALDQLLQGNVATTDARTSGEGSSNSLLTDKDTAEQPTTPVETLLENRDSEMEEEIIMNITGDPLAEYDIEVQKEGEAILEYLKMLDAVRVGS